MHLVYSFGELNKSKWLDLVNAHAADNTRAAFFELPEELQTKAGRDRIRRISINRSHLNSGIASGRTTPTSTDGMGEDLSQPLPGVYYGGGGDKVDYDQFPLTPLGQLLNLCMTSGIVNYPHPSVTLQYFETAVRYVEFWRSKNGSIQPMFEAMLDQRWVSKARVSWQVRGIHHPDESVRRRCFYLLAKFVKETRVELDVDVVPPVIESMRVSQWHYIRANQQDMMVINAELPKPDVPDEDLLLKATTGRSYFQDQLYLFEAAGSLIYITRIEPSRQISLLESTAGPLMAGIGAGLQRRTELDAVLSVHHHLLALGNLAKGFPQAPDSTVEALPYQGAFKQMTEALLEALDQMKTQRIVRDAVSGEFTRMSSKLISV
jgi:exportin-T